LVDVRVDLAFGHLALPEDGWEVMLSTYSDKSLWGPRVGRQVPRKHLNDPFRFANVPFGELEVLATREGYPSVRQRLTVSPDQDDPALTMVIAGGSASLSGQLVPPKSEYLLLRNGDCSLTQKIIVDEQGRFHVEHLPPGHYFIGPNDGGRGKRTALAEVSLGPGEHERVEIADDAHPPVDGYIVLSLVTDRGIPLATSDISLEGNGQVIRPYFNSDDSNSFEGMPGQYTLFARHPGFKTLQVPVEMISSQGRSMREILRPVFITVRQE
jgi:hypothetical protein